ncbi:hypothetical protein Bca4012_089189 [Brassica carinata]
MTLQRGLPLLWQQYTALFWKNFLLSWRSKRAMFLQLFASFFFILLIFCIQEAMEKSFASSTAHKTVTDPTALTSPPIPRWRPIPEDKVRSFAAPDDVDAWLMANPLRTPGALHFKERNPTVISYGIQTNSTPEIRRGRFEDPTFKFQIPLQVAAEREIARSLIGDPKFNWVFGFKEFPHPTIEAFVALDAIGPTFFLAIAMFGFVLQISSLITEKELKLRQFDFFLKNSFPVVFQLFMLFQINMVEKKKESLTLTLHTYWRIYIPLFHGLLDWTSIHAISKASSATTVGFLEFLVGFITQLGGSTGFPYSKDYSLMTRVLWSLFPPNTFSQGLKLLSDATLTPQDPSISWIPNASRVRKSAFYFLKPGYWTGKGGNRVEVQIRGLAKTYPGTTKFGCCKCKKTALYLALKGLWMNIAKDQLFCLLGPNGAGKTTTINCLTGINPVTGGDALIYGNPVRSSVGMSNIRKMIGVCPQFDILWDALSGEEHLRLFASVKGLPPASINPMVKKSLAEVKLTEAGKIRAGSYSGGMKRRLNVAVSHIGMDPITRRHVWDIIQETKEGRAIILTTHSMEEADILSDRIGILAKGRLRCIGTSIKLKSRFGTGFVTNISFAESNNQENNNNDHNGEAGAEDSDERVMKFFKDHLNVKPVEENKAFMTFVIPHEKKNLLAKFYDELLDKETDIGISDIQLGLATLEEVFLNIARKAELESAAVDGTTSTLELTSGSSVEVINLHLIHSYLFVDAIQSIDTSWGKICWDTRNETAENPRRIMVEVYWQQDESGSLCILGHSPEMSVPENVPAADPVAPGHGGGVSLLGRRGRRQQVQGTVIDPEFVRFSTTSRRISRSGSFASRRFSRSGSFASKRSSL